MSLRSKLFLAFGGLLAILLLVGGLSLGVQRQYARAVARVDHDQYDTVHASFALSGAISAVNETVLSHFSDPPAKFQAALAEPIAAVDLELATEEQLPRLDEDEARLRNEVKEAWAAYHGTVQELTSKAPSRERRAFLGERIQPDLERLRQAEMALRADSLERVVQATAAARLRSDTISQAMIALLCSGALLGIVYMIFVSRFIMAPINALSGSLRQIESGNLDCELEVRSQDELGQLGEAYNQMAARLREFRKVDAARMTRIQQTTQMAIDSLRDAVALFDADGVIEVSNTCAKEVLGLYPGKAAADFDFHWLNRLLDQVGTHQEPIFPRTFEGAIQFFREGRELFFLPNAMPIFQNQDFVGVTIVLADVTLLRRLDEMKTGMVSTASHELRTPLTSIQMALHMLKSCRFGNLNQQQTELLATAVADSGRLMSTIEGILDLSRLQSGGTQIDIEDIQPLELVNEAVKLQAPAFAEKGIALRVEVEEGLPHVLGDPRLLGIVLSNLLTNALKYCPAGREVILRAGKHDHSLTLVVQDSGEGFAREYCERIFDRFFRLPSASSQKGAGLGLAICREIINAHSGCIACESDIGQGTRFVVTLPLPGSPDPECNNAREDDPPGAVG